MKVAEITFDRKSGFVVSNDDFYVKAIYPHVTFTTSEDDALLCLTKTETEAIQEYINKHFSF